MYGGARQGAGRAYGTKSVKVRKIAEDWIDAGHLTPLEVQLMEMEYHYKEGMKHRRSYEALTTKDKARRDGIRCYRMMQAETEVACERAREAAPFIHPKLQAVTLEGVEDGAPIRYQRVERVIIDPSIQAEES